MTKTQVAANVAEALQALADQLRGQARGTPLSYEEILEALGQAYDQLEEAVAGHP